MPADTHETETSAANRIGEGLRILGLAITTLAVAVVPWFLGGAIPQADLVLQAGAVIAGACTLAGMLLCGDWGRRLPLTCLPLLGMALIGVIQLVPICTPPVLQMEHAVQFELVDQLPATLDPAIAFTRSPRSVMPAETRQWVSRMMSLVLVTLVVFEAARSRTHLLLVAATLVFSGCAMSVFAIPQQLSGGAVVIGNDWKISETTPFGCFVNPNNAAGWLISCLAAALFLMGVLFQSRHPAEARTSRLRASSTERFREAWMTFVGRIADLTPMQILAISAVILLMAAIAVTLSRAGVSAAVLGLIAFLVSRSFSGRLLAATCSVLVLVAVSCSLLVLMELDTIVLSELQTLKDPVSDSTGRLLHWSDSLQSGFDFPFLGSGLGAYRFATLPYQRHYTGKWFQRADNQYVELFVESGLAGVVCMLAFVVLALVFARRATTLKTVRQNRKTDLADRLGSSVVFLGAALAGAAFFDYGISLPSVAGVVVVIVVLLEKYSLASGSGVEKGSTSEEWYLKLPGLLVVGIWLSLVISTAALIPNTAAAARVFEAIVPAERLLNRPDLAVLMDSGDAVLKQLSIALERCPDDLQGHRTRVLFLELLFQRELTTGLLKEKGLTVAQAENVFRELTPVRLADRILDEKASDTMKMAVRSEVESALQKYPWHTESRRLMEQSSCILTIALPLAASEILLARPAEAMDALNYARFSEPHSAPTLFILGSFMLQMGRQEECRTCWAQSIAASDAFYPQILKRLAATLGPEVALTWFLPTTYESCVKCAVELTGVPAIQQSLLERAEQIWESDRPRETDQVVVARVRYLEATGVPAEAAQYLEERLAEHPRSVPLRKSRAKVLERAGRNGEAYDEWLRVQSFDASDKEIEGALERLIKLPPTTYK